jgi:D-isomer specific 2-hydroxyacid dehydrogenase, NAD binding domain
LTDIYVDGDACPVREEIYRVAKRRGRFRNPDDARDAGNSGDVQHHAVRANEAWGVLRQYRARSLRGDRRSGRGATLRPSRWSRLDVADPEPLPPDHPLWSMPNVLITPHIAIYGTPYREKWEAMLIENCRRFAAGQPLLNLVDKEKWF